MGLLVQHAYGKSDKIETGISDGSVSGIILSPRVEKPLKLEEYIEDKQRNGIELFLDPQFYLCAFEGAVNVGKLEQYEFYINSGVNKKYLSMSQNIHEIVKRNIDYQRKCKLVNLVSPNIFFESFDSRMSQIALSLANEAQEYCKGEQLYITLGIHEMAFANFSDVCDFLDIISLFDVTGFYIIIERNSENNANIIKSDIMANILYFLYNLAEINAFRVILGYGDYIGLPLYVSGIDSIATGWYGNSRKFDRANFEPISGGRRPNKRYYSNKLLNALLLTPEISLIQTNNMLGKVLSNTKYDDKMYNDLGGALWTDSISCLERWEAIKQILDKVDSKKSTLEKITFMRNIIQNAKNIYEDLPEHLFDSKSKSTHLDAWDVGLKIFEEKIEKL